MNKETQDWIKKSWGNERPIWVFCPICEGFLEGEGVLRSGHSTRKCEACQYSYQQRGSYASRVTIRGEGFGLDDMFGDSEKMWQRIAELKSRSEMKIGTLVKMSEQLKEILIALGCENHVRRHGQGEGTVIGPMDGGNSEYEVNVRWSGDNSHYGYKVEDLVVVGLKKHRSIDDTDEQPSVPTDDPHLRSRLFLRAKLNARQP